MRRILINFILQIDPLAKHHGSKIDAGYVKNFHSRYNKTNGMHVVEGMDKAKILQSILSKQLSPERYNGVMNLFYIFQNPNATTADITSALVNAGNNEYNLNGISKASMNLQ